jgi:hypothetical protein
MLLGSFEVSARTLLQNGVSTRMAGTGPGFKVDLSYLPVRCFAIGLLRGYDFQFKQYERKTIPPNP